MRIELSSVLCTEFIRRMCAQTKPDTLESPSNIGEEIRRFHAESAFAESDRLAFVIKDETCKERVSYVL